MADNFLSIGLTLLVLALTLVVQWSVMKGGKKVSLRRMGLSLMVLGASVGALVAIFAIFTQALSNQGWGVFRDTSLAIVLTGGVLWVQGEVEKKQSLLPVVMYCAIGVMLISFGFVVCSIILNINAS